MDAGGSASGAARTAGCSHAVGTAERPVYATAGCIRAADTARQGKSDRHQAAWRAEAAPPGPKSAWGARFSTKTACTRKSETSAKARTRSTEAAERV